MRFDDVPAFLDALHGTPIPVAVDFRYCTGAAFVSPPQSFDWLPVEERAHARNYAQLTDIITAHMPDCYGAPRSCVRCVCDRQGKRGDPTACTTHAYLLAAARYHA